MKTRRWLVIVAVLAATALAVTYWLRPDAVAPFFSDGGEHTFAGKASSQWRADLRAELANLDKHAQPVSHALQNGADAETVPVLVDLLDDDDVRVRRVAALFLRDHFVRQAGPETAAAIGPLTTRLQDDDGMVRRRAVQALSYLGGQAGEAVPAIARLLKDPEEAIAVEAALALGNAGPGARAAVAPLREAVRDPRSTVQKAAAQALRRIESGQNDSRER